MISIESRGSFSKTRAFFNRMLNHSHLESLSSYGEQGVVALSKATPVDSGLTASSWKYRIVRTKRGPTVEWYNTHKVNGTSVAILIQYGHGTRGGTYVQGRDFINPGIQPIFDKISDDVWRKVKA